MNTAAKCDLDEADRARRIAEDTQLAKIRATPDAVGISSDMIESMVQTMAEGLHTGATDMRHLMYCAYRNAREIQKTYEAP